MSVFAIVEKPSSPELKLGRHVFENVRGHRFMFPVFLEFVFEAVYSFLEISECTDPVYCYDSL